MNEVCFTPVCDENLTQIMDVYNHYVFYTTVTFSIHPFSHEEIKNMVYFDNKRYSSFIITFDNTFCGYCILGPYKKREAYAKTAEVSIYLKKEFTGKGIGTKALTFLEQKAIERNMHVLIAIICEENTASISLFKKCGYDTCAHLKEVGYKFERNLDVVFLQKIL